MENSLVYNSDGTMYLYTQECSSFRHSGYKIPTSDRTSILETNSNDSWLQTCWPSHKSLNRPTCSDNRFCKTLNAKTSVPRRVVSTTPVVPFRFATITNDHIIIPVDSAVKSSRVLNCCGFAHLTWHIYRCCRRVYTNNIPQVYVYCVWTLL